jgi:hypothetical protein
MKRAILIFFMVSGTAACANSRISDAPPVRPAQAWRPISVADVSNPDIRQTVTDLLRLVDSDFLWPDLTLSDHGVIIVDTRDPQRPAAYCVGICEPAEIVGGGTSRLWHSTPPETIPPGQFRFVSLSNWGLRGTGDVVAIGFESRERSVVTALHEDFHLHYESRYALSFGDEIGNDPGLPSRATRGNLESTYSRSEPTRGELREECVALVAALQAGPLDRQTAFAALRRFTAIRDSRRGRPNAPSFEEDFWERQEGIPTNLERRAAAHMKFADRSAIGAAQASHGCDGIANGSYFLLLGGLEAAVLDTFSDPLVWPRLVYPHDGTPASSLYLLVRALLSPSEER